jgi:hypothetical protein
MMDLYLYMILEKKMALHRKSLGLFLAHPLGVYQPVGALMVKRSMQEEGMERVFL